MGERDDQAVVVHELAGDAGLRHTEIDLRDAGRPEELAVSVGTAPVRLAPASHVPRRRRVLAVVAGLRAEPVMHAFGGVALLAGQHAVGASSHPSTNAAYGSILEPRRLSVGGFGVMSSMSAYFATVARSTFSLLAISDLDTP